MEILKRNNLSAEDLVLWEQTLIGIPEDFRAKFEDFFTLYPDSVSFANKLIKEERDAMINNDEEKIKSVFKSIEGYLNL